MPSQKLLSSTLPVLDSHWNVGCNKLPFTSRSVCHSFGLACSSSWRFSCLYFFRWKKIQAFYRLSLCTL